jgi:hypothetical protein
MKETKFKVGDLITLESNMKELLGVKEDAIGVVVRITPQYDASKVWESPDKDYLNEGYIIEWMGNPYIEWDLTTMVSPLPEIYQLFYGYELKLVQSG